jgi:hypothetical protein
MEKITSGRENSNTVHIYCTYMAADSAVSPLCKREVLASLKEEGGTIPIIVEDLTAATLAKMKELKEDERIEKVWTTEGSIRFTLVADPEKVRKFPGAFTPISEVLK